MAENLASPLMAESRGPALAGYLPGFLPAIRTAPFTGGPVMLRSLGAILAGFVTATVLVMACTFVAVAAMLPAAGPGQMPAPTSAYLAVNLAYSLLAAFIGGEVTARLAPRAPLGHAMALGVVLLVLGVGGAALTSDGAKGSQPGWYLYAVATLGWIGASAGGMRRARGIAAAR